MSLRDNLKILREKKQITGKEFAKDIGVNYATYMAYENKDKDKARWPSEDNLIRIAAALHVTTDELLGYDGESVWRKKYEKAQRQLDSIRGILK